MTRPRTRLRRLDSATRWDDAAIRLLGDNPDWLDKLVSWDPREEAGPGPALDRLDRAELDHYLDRLAAISPREADCLDLSARGSRMVDIGVVLGDEGFPLTQAACSYMKQRAIERVRYMRWLDGLRLDEDIIEAVLLRAAVPAGHRTIVLSYWRTGSYSVSARELDPAVLGDGHSGRWQEQRVGARVRVAAGQIGRYMVRAPDDEDAARVRTWLVDGQSGALVPGLERSREWREAMSVPQQRTKL